MIHLPSLLACATCMSGTGDGPSVAASWSILFMLVFVLCPVLGGFLGLVLTLKRREAAALAREAALGG